MKRKATNIVLFVAMVLFLANNSIAQTTSPQPCMAMSISIVQEGRVLNDAGSARVNVRTMRDFNKRFAGRQADWTTTGEIFQAKLSDDTIRTVVGYGKLGGWLYTIKYYSEKQMPGELRHVIKSIYYDDKIDLINEVRIPQSKKEIYIIHIHNDKKVHKILRFSDEGIELVKTYRDNQRL